MKDVKESEKILKRCEKILKKTVYNHTQRERNRANSLIPPYGAKKRRCARKRVMNPLFKHFRFLRNLLIGEILSEKKESYHGKFDNFYQGERWRRLRAEKFAAACGLCEKCKANGMIRAGKEVHHIIPIEKNWDLRYAFDNLILLCPKCHNEEHDRISSLQKFNRIWEELNGRSSSDNGSE